MFLHGIFPPITTPFYPDGNIYFRKLEQNVEHYSRTPTVVDHFKPLTPAQATQLRDQAKELSEKPNPTAEDRQKIAEIRAKLIGFVRRPTTPAIAETVRVQIVLSADAPLGERELRLVTPNGLTNP